MLQPFEQQLISRWTGRDWSDVTVVAAISGGPDSMALLRAMLAAQSHWQGRMIAAHFNHRLRSSESDNDESFVRDHCSRLGIQLEADAADVPNGPAAEDAARQVRYDFFRNLAERMGARYVVTAHTADDQVETILHRILRGTGLDGLSGIPESREFIPGVSLLRPILWASRADVLAYLQAIDQPFRQDSSNLSTQFTRNRLRNALIPQLEKEYNPRVKEALLRLGELAAEAQRTILKSTQEIRGSAVLHITPHNIDLRCSAFLDIDPHLARQTLVHIWREAGWPMQEMTAEHWHKLTQFVSSESGVLLRATFPRGITAERDDNTLRLHQPNVALHTA